MSEVRADPWKIATLTILASLAGALASGLVVAQVIEAGAATNPPMVDPAGEPLEPLAVERPDPDLGVAVEPEPDPAQAQAPPPAPVGVAAAPQQRAVVEERRVPDRAYCERIAAETRRNGGRIAKDAVIGGAIGAGLGAAGGAIAKGGKGAGKGAGIGALVGLAGGTLYGVNEENRRAEAARRAYHDCMAGRPH